MAITDTMVVLVSGKKYIFKMQSEKIEAPTEDIEDVK